MGHFIFCILHLLVIVLGAAGLFITIPLHLTYYAIKAPKETLRADGKKRTGGLLGWLWDDLVIANKKMKQD